jgi:hypothetical protein
MDKITATPIGDGLWFVECSLCGPIGVTEDALTVLMSREHFANHVVA